MADIEFVKQFPHNHTAGEIDDVLTTVVERLHAQRDTLATPLRRTFRGHPLPSRSEIVHVVELLRSVIFPGYFGNRDVTDESLNFHLGAVLHQASLIMVDEVHRGLCFACSKEPEARTPATCLAKAKRITATFLEQLPELRRLLALDAIAAYEGDPAATGPSEAIFCYPGVRALTNHRIAHELYRLDVPLIPRIIAEHAHSETGIDIHPGARIGEKFFIDHGTGVVIGETTIIGDRVRVYQGVTLGAKSFPLDAEGNPIKGIDRHPIIEDEVTIYSGATILGRVTIGRGAIIGGNVWLTRDVPPGSRISQGRPTAQLFEAGGGI
ncbi:MAG: serine acetyltransferase [Holophagae bacterium]|jgi:serine O-acetyltransferase